MFIDRHFGSMISASFTIWSFWSRTFRRIKTNSKPRVFSNHFHNCCLNCTKGSIENGKAKSMVCKNSVVAAAHLKGPFSGTHIYWHNITNDNGLHLSASNGRSKFAKKEIHKSAILGPPSIKWTTHYSNGVTLVLMHVRTYGEINICYNTIYIAPSSKNGYNWEADREEKQATQ